MSGLIGRPGITDWEVAEELLHEARGRFSSAEHVFDSRGYDTAAENLRRYRSGRGDLEEYSDEEIARHPALLNAEDRNRTRFESNTFTGRTNNDEMNRELPGLANGASHRFGDHWDFSVPWSRPSTYLAFGGTSVTSRGEFNTHRNGACSRFAASWGTALG